MNSIRNRKLFGFIVCDIETPPDLQEEMKLFPPIIKRMRLTNDNLTPYMAERLRKHYQKDAKLDRETVVQCFNAEQHLLMTPLVRFYLDLGLKITKIYRVIQYRPFRSISPFVKHVTAMRLEAEREGKKTKANTAKTFGNSGYGKVKYKI